MTTLADNFLTGASAFLDCIANPNEQRIASISHDMEDATERAKDAGLLRSILRADCMEDNEVANFFQRGITDQKCVADRFKTLVGYQEFETQQNDKIDWDVDANGETLFTIHPIKYYYLKPGLLHDWGYVKMRPVYIGEVYFGNPNWKPISPGSTAIDEATESFNWITSEACAEILRYHSEACKFLSGIVASELKLYMEPMKKQDAAKLLGMTDKQLQRGLKDGSVKHLAVNGQNIRLHTDHLKNNPNLKVDKTGQA